MIIDKVENAYTYASYGRYMRKALDYMCNVDLDKLEVTNHIDIDGENVFAKVFEKTLESEIVDSHQWESHEEYIDIWCPCTDVPQWVGWREVAGLEAVAPYDAKEDITFFKGSDKYSLVLLEKGYFMVLDTNDAHMVGSFAYKNASPTVKTLVIKVKI